MVKSPERKRPKLDDNVVLADISNMSQDVTEPTTAVYRVPQLGERKVYRRRPTSGTDYQTVTTARGDRYYLRFSKDEAGEGGSEEEGLVRSSGGLCGRSYGDIYREALMEQSKIAKEAEQREAGKVIWIYF